MHHGAMTQPETHLSPARADATRHIRPPWAFPLLLALLLSCAPLRRAPLALAEAQQLPLQPHAAQQLPLTTPAAATPVARHLAPPASQCQLTIQGSSSSGLALPPGTSKLQAPPRVTLSCTGSPITAAAHESIAAALRKTAQGVRWDPAGCENLGCLVTICGSSSAVFKDVRVQGVTAQGLSAAVCVSGSSTVVFQGGSFSAVSTNQGALLVLGSSTVSLEATRVTNNTAKADIGPITLGGGLLAQEQAHVTLTDCVFAGNRAIGNIAAFGAAVSAQDQSQVVVAGGVFRGNTAEAPAKGVGAALGGAVYAEGSASVEAHGVSFVGNAAKGQVVSVGGAACVMHDASLTLSGCSFADNTALSPNIGVGGAMGALNHTVVRITGGSLVNNSASGGALLGAGGAVLADNHAAIHISGTRMLDNRANGSLVGAGGAINVVADASLTLHSVLVSGNEVSAPRGAVLGGGVACMNTTRCVVQDSEIVRNNASSGQMPAAGGGVGVLDQARVHLLRSNVSHNLVRGALAVAGGGVMTQGSDTQLVADNCTFENNTVAANEFRSSFAGGGAVGAQGPPELEFRLRVQADLSDLRGSYMPGVSRSVVRLQRCRFLHNQVAGVTGATGGAVFAGDGAVRVQVDACRFVGNRVGGIAGFVVPPLICCGGAVAVQERSLMRVTDSSFEGNFVEGVRSCGGAACAQNGGTMTVVASRFDRNAAAGVNTDSSGGVLHGGTTCGGGACATNNGTISVDRCVFGANSASGVSNGGGACATIASRLSLSGTAFRHNVAEGAGGGVGVGDGCTALLSRCIFVNNTASNPETGCGGGVSIAAVTVQGEQQATCKVDACSFTGNAAMGRRGSGGGVYAANAALQISSSSFANNTAQQGGALGGSGVSWVLRDSSFSGHSAAGPGGAIFTMGGVEVSIAGCKISSNRGSEGGGVYAASSAGSAFKLALQDTHITANQAQTGGGLFLKAGVTHIGPGTLIQHNHASQQAGGLGWVGSAQVQPTGCTTGGSGVQLAAAACRSVLDISCSAAVSQNHAGVAGGGLFLGEAFDTDLDVVGKCVAQVVTNNSAAFGSVDIFQVSSVCKAGQVSKGGWCDECGVNLYSFDPAAGRCEVCPAHAVCLGGAVLLPEPGFWHSTNNSTQIHPCPNPAACNHSVAAINARQPIDWQCAEGYVGHVCGSCDPDGFGFSTPFKCGRCMSFGKTVGLYMAAVTCLVLFLWYSAHTTFKDNLQQRSAPRLSDTIKALLLYLNYLVIFASIRVDWPKSLSVLYTAATWLLSSASGQVLSLDCMLPHDDGPVPLAIKRQLVYLLVPLAITAVVLLLFGMSWAFPAVTRCGRRPRAFCARVGVKLPTAVLVCLYLFYPGFVRVAWGMFACLPLDNPDSTSPYPQYSTAVAPHGWWVQDLSQACYQGWHLSWSMGLGLPAVLLFCLCVPLALLLWLAAHRRDLKHPAFQMHYGFLYADFRQDRWWFESLVAARTVLLCCIAVFASVVGPYYGVVMFVVVIHLSVALQLGLQPFAFRQLERVQLAALGCLDITGCVALTFFVVDWDTPSKGFTAYKEAAGAVLLLLHAAFICWCLWQMLAGVPVQRVRALVGHMPHLQCGCLHPSGGSLASCCKVTPQQHVDEQPEPVLPCSASPSALQKQAAGQSPAAASVLRQHKLAGGTGAASGCKGHGGGSTPAAGAKGGSCVREDVAVELPSAACVMGCKDSH